MKGSDDDEILSELEETVIWYDIKKRMLSAADKLIAEASASDVVDIGRVRGLEQCKTKLKDWNPISEARVAGRRRVRIKHWEGRRVNMLTVLSIHPEYINGEIAWLVECDCGKRRLVRARDLQRGAKSCGCYQNLYGALTHGHTANGKDSRTYRSWTAMIRRCTKANEPSYPEYGGRGIKVCERWRSFENFLADMGERPAGTSIDRIDSNGDYEPGNCRWSDPATQGQNRRDTKLNAVSVCLIRHMRKRKYKLRDLAEAFGCSEIHIYNVVTRRTWKRMSFETGK